MREPTNQYAYLPMRAGICAFALLISGCGGGGYGGASAPTPASVVISATPSTINLGQTATIAWSSNGATCTASGAWSGSKAAQGTEVVTPSTGGQLDYSVACAGGAYVSSRTHTATLTVQITLGFSATNLVSDGAVSSAVIDAGLVNPWGLASSPTGPMSVANNGTQTSTAYDGMGTKQSTIVSIPAGNSGPANPTGIAFNASTDFTVSKNSFSSPAQFIFAGEGGTISAWAPIVEPGNAITVYDDGAGGAIYKGLAIWSGSTSAADVPNRLYATDFHNNKIDVFDSAFTKITVAGGFVNPQLPPGYAPFGIQFWPPLTLIVTYAKQDMARRDPVRGAGLGIVALFDLDGRFEQIFVDTGGVLNAPWGIALTPVGFGKLPEETVLIGNFGDGIVNAFTFSSDDSDFSSGSDFLGSVSDGTGAPIVIPGLWGIAFGNGTNNQSGSSLFFTAGASNETAGVYGRIDPPP